MRILCIGVSALALFFAGIYCTIGAVKMEGREWSDEKSNPYYCAIHQGGGYDIDLLLSSGRSAKISLLKGGRTLFAIDGHKGSVFAVVNDILYYAQYIESGMGGTIVAVDLKSGKEMWSKELQGLPKRRHRAYSNSLNLQVDFQGAPRRLIVEVEGHETFGDYSEILDATTGEQISHVIIIQNPEPASQPVPTSQPIPK